ncbi:MAG: hypothetical protein O2905_07425, partial [Proteobacteria bacterium]|nr:hypothetical protein [Pseudomonadota bacterium]
TQGARTLGAHLSGAAPMHKVDRTLPRPEDAMPAGDPTADLEDALGRLEAEVAALLQRDRALPNDDLAKVTAERDALRAAVDAAEERIDHTIAAIRALVEGSGNG